MTTDRRAAADVLRQTDGKFGHSMERLCVCGHTKGKHGCDHKGRAMGCLAGTGIPDDDTPEPCDCEKFKAARK